MRISDQMSNILLAMRKAEKDPDSQIGQIMLNHAKTYGTGGLATMDLMTFLKGQLTLDAEGETRHSVRRSFWRSLKKLLEYDLIRVTSQKKPGTHGYLYGLTPKGRAKTEEIWARASMFVEEYSRLL